MSKGVASTFLDGDATPLVVRFGQLERHPYRTTKTIQDRSRAGGAPKPTSTPAPIAAPISISSIGKVCSSSILASPSRGCGEVTDESPERLAPERPQRDSDMNSLNLATSENIC
jgi:hypothetical protein